MSQIQLKVHFSGRVQGVGFRYHTHQIAREFEVSGYVRNLDDGRVLLEARGEESEVQGFIAEIEDRLSVFIRSTEKQPVDPPERFSG
ncbi:MAG: acylphosphatase, partial [Opitutales bacterium]|nr:acylphosphatase [Opitutales bacterium]